MKTTVSEKGQITIPKRVRDSLGVRAGDVLELKEVDGSFVATKITQGRTFRSLVGLLNNPSSSDEFLDEIRGPAEL